MRQERIDASQLELNEKVDVYLPKLVRAGQRVAICEQLEDPKLTKKYGAQNETYIED